MKRFLLISLLYLFSHSIMAQKVTIKVFQAKNTGLTGWQIIDDQNLTIFSGNEYLHTDTVTYSLDANKYYFLKISVSVNIIPDTALCSLILNDEPIIFIKSDVGKGEHLFPFFTGVRSVNAKIVGGTNAVISDFPWQVYYISGNFRCGGTIIDGKWVVTAAHCTLNNTGGAIPASEMFVKVGANNPSGTSGEGKTYPVSQAIVHEGFDSQTLLNDIALLKLKDTINFTNAKPIKFITSDDVAENAIVPGVMSWVTGYGLIRVNPNVLPSVLQKVQLPIVSNAQASVVWSSIPATDLMAGYLNGNKDACNGDSGGPLIVPVLGGDYKLAGIVSWGSTNCNTYGAYTRVSDFETWIRTITGITKDFKPAAPTGPNIVCQGTQSDQYFIDPIPGATAYEWKVSPESAGAISWNAENASILWDISYTGAVTVMVRVIIDNKLSDWSGTNVNIVLNTNLLSQTKDTIICAFKPVTLNVNAIGYNLLYKWFKDGQSVQSGSSSKLNFQSASTDNTGTYYCEISGSCGTVVSGNIKLTVYPLTKITHLSPDAEVPFGSDITLEVDADGHDLTYQWQKDNVALENSNTSRLFIGNMNATNIGIYRTTVTGTCGIEISDSIYVYVKRANFTTEPEVFLWPSITIDEFTVALSNDSFYNIQVFNSGGKKIKELTNCRYPAKINIETLAKGVYIVVVYNNDFRKSIKIIKN